MDGLFERLLQKAEQMLLVLVGDTETPGLIAAKCELREIVEECKEADKTPVERDPDQMSGDAEHLSKPIEDEPAPVARFRSDQEFIEGFRNSD